MRYNLKCLCILGLVLFTVGCSNQEKVQPKLEVRIDYNSNLIHFIDYLSQWSEYVDKDALSFYEKHFDLNEQDNKMLNKYSIARERLGWEKEIDLFNWAYNEFKIDSTTPKEYDELKSVIEYFSNKKDEHQTLEKLLKEEYSKLLSLEPQIRKYSLNIEKTYSDIDPYLSLWTPKYDFSKYPIYIFFSHTDHSASGGANGNGVFSEFVINDGEEGINRGFSTITHELTHKVTKIGAYLIGFIKDKDSYTSKANNFLKQNNLTKTKLLRIFESIDTLGFGNSESYVFEEVNTYFIAPVMVDNMTKKQISDNVIKYNEKGAKELERIWYGVQLFKKEYERRDFTDLNKKEFIWKLIEIYYTKVYFENYIAK